MPVENLSNFMLNKNKHSRSRIVPAGTSRCSRVRVVCSGQKKAAGCSFFVCPTPYRSFCRVERPLVSTCLEASRGKNQASMGITGVRLKRIIRCICFRGFNSIRSRIRENAFLLFFKFIAICNIILPTHSEGYIALRSGSNLCR